MSQRPVRRYHPSDALVDPPWRRSRTGTCPVRLRGRIPAEQRPPPTSHGSDTAVGSAISTIRSRWGNLSIAPFGNRYPGLTLAPGVIATPAAEVDAHSIDIK